MGARERRRRRTTLAIARGSPRCRGPVGGGAQLFALRIATDAMLTIDVATPIAVARSGDLPPAARLSRSAAAFQYPLRSQNAVPWI